MTKHIEIEPSDAHVKISLDGTVLAESDRPVLLHEGGCPTRYYLPAEDVKAELIDSDKHTTCPYKGEASYKSVVLNGTTVENLVWLYPDPIPEAAGIAGLLCFYNEKVDIEV